MESFSEAATDRPSKIPIAVFLHPGDSHGRKIARSLGLDIADARCAPDSWYLVLSKGRLALRDGSKPLFGLRADGIRDRLGGSRDSELSKACGAIRRPYVFDALGGWGLDALALCSLKCRVVLTESVPIVCAVARHFARELNLPLTSHCADAMDFLRETRESFDVIYLDPLFPEHRKGSLPSLQMQVLRSLAQTETDLEELFRLSLANALNRVVVKHRRNQSPLFGKPDWQIEGRTIRFDVYRVNA